MRTTDPGDAARIELLLAELRLPAIKLIWASLAAQADKEGWPAGRFLAALAEHEIAERSRRRLERHLAQARSCWLPRASLVPMMTWCDWWCRSSNAAACSKKN